jgi:hypothetical protein
VPRHDLRGRVGQQRAQFPARVVLLDLGLPRLRDCGSCAGRDRTRASSSGVGNLEGCRGMVRR